MKKIFAVLLICVVTLFYAGCSEEQIPLEQVPSEITPNPDTEMSISKNEPQNHQLAALASKSVEEYTIEDVRLILSSTQEEITKAFDLPAQQEGGLLLNGQMYALRTYWLVFGVFTFSSIIMSNSWEDVSFKDITLVMYGPYGTKSILEEFQYGMILDETKYDVEDSFYKLCEGCDIQPAKRINVQCQDLCMELYFINYPNENEYILDSIHIAIIDNY